MIAFAVKQSGSLCCLVQVVRYNMPPQMDSRPPNGTLHQEMTRAVTFRDRGYSSLKQRDL
jgi:hypothetical protein